MDRILALIYRYHWDQHFVWSVAGMYAAHGGFTLVTRLTGMLLCPYSWALGVVVIIAIGKEVVDVIWNNGNFTDTMGDLISDGLGIGEYSLIWFLCFGGRI